MQPKPELAQKCNSESFYFFLLIIVVMLGLLLVCCGCRKIPHAYYVPDTGEVVIPYRNEIITIPSTMVEDICKLRSQEL